MQILLDTPLNKQTAGWDLPEQALDGYTPASDGVVLSAETSQPARLSGPGVHTRNGDQIELYFRPLAGKTGCLKFGFSGGMESAMVSLDFEKGIASLFTSEWTRSQPVCSAEFTLADRDHHILILKKTEGQGRYVKSANITVQLDDELVLSETDLNILPEIGVMLECQETRILVNRFVHRGQPSAIPEYLHVGGWQSLNQPSIEANLKSIFHGLDLAADQGVQLLLTPETSLTGLFPYDPVTYDRDSILDAENKLRQKIRNLRNAPYVVVGLPIWDTANTTSRTGTMPEGHQTRYNISRIYDPDGHIMSSYAKIHSCEFDFWHGYQLQEFNIYGVPVCMHICHDGRYPEVWTLPVMFGARLILHPANGGLVTGSIDAFEANASRSTTTSHAFYVYVNGGGGSYIAGPQKYNNLIAVSAECERNVTSFPMVGEPQESLLIASIRIADAFGYWPVRSFRSSEAIAESYLALYQAYSGRHMPI